MSWESVSGSPFVYQDVVVANGATDSAEIELGVYTICKIAIPSGLEGTTLGFKSAPSSGGTFQEVYTDGAAWSETVAASKDVHIDTNKALALHPFCKLVLGEQTGAITLRVWAFQVGSRGFGF